MDEFKLINSFFRPKEPHKPNTEGVVLGIGDDCALLTRDSHSVLAVSVDTLIEGVHFPAAAPPQLVAHRALAVSVSDLAAMGAEPLCFTLALTLPRAEEDWLKEFSSGLHAAAEHLQCELAGGDTTRGESLSLSVQVMGKVAKDQALLRSGAKVGDQVYVTGPLGDGAAALAYLQKRINIPDSDLADYFVQRFYKPQPQISAGIALRKIASSAIDISDGLLADLGHVCRVSGVAARIELSRLPITRTLLPQTTLTQLQQWALTGGDDYHLCFTVPKQRQAKLEEQLNSEAFSAYLIGEIIPANDDALVTVIGADQLKIDQQGYRHFA